MALPWIPRRSRRIWKSRTSISTTRRSKASGTGRIRSIDDLESAYYLSIDTVDRPGVLAAVASVFGAHDVSIASMEQEGRGDAARIVFVTHRAREADVQATVAELRGLDAVRRVNNLIRVLGAESEG